MTPSVNTVTVCLGDCSPLRACLNVCVSYVHRRDGSTCTHLKHEMQIERERKGDARMKMGRREGETDKKREGWWLFFCLELQPVSLAHPPAPPYHHFSSSSSSSLAPQPQTESLVTVLMAALYSLSPPHTPPPPNSARDGGLP